MLQDSFSEQPDLPTSLLCSILFTGYLLNRGSNTNCLCFALRSFLVMLPSTFQNFFTFTLPPGSSAVIQTPECSEYHPSEQRPVVSALSLTRLQLSGISSLFLSVILPLSAPENLSLFINLFFSFIALIALICDCCMYICVCVCVCSRVVRIEF